MSAEINDTIEERLYELKEMVAPVSYDELLRTFDWSYIWFRKAEKILLDLAYRGDSDKEIVEFIRHKVLNTNILEFNDSFLNVHGLKTIKNHYETILCRKKQRYSLMTNKNKSIVDYIIDNYIDIFKVDGKMLSACISDTAVEYLIENPDEIDWFELSNNPNIKAMKYCIDNNVIYSRNLSKVRDEEFMRYLMMSPNTKLDLLELSQNPSNTVADFFVQNPDVIQALDLEYNTNPRVVEFLLENLDKIDFGTFSSNSNDRAVDYMLANPDKIDFDGLSSNTNDRAVEYLLQYPEKINWMNFSGNTSDRAVKYAINNPDKIILNEFCNNPNDYAVEFMLSFDEYPLVLSDYNLGYMLSPKCFNVCCLSGNTCEYNKQKIEAFNNAKVFPKIPHFSI